MARKETKLERANRLLRAARQEIRARGKAYEELSEERWELERELMDARSDLHQMSLPGSAGEEARQEYRYRDASPVGFAESSLKETAERSLKALVGGRG